MRRHVGSSDGLAAALHLSPELNDAEFRILVLLAERPSGEFFEGSIQYLVSKGMHRDDAVDAASSLADVRVFDDPHKGMPGSIFEIHKDGRLIWRFF